MTGASPRLYSRERRGRTYFSHIRGRRSEWRTHRLHLPTVFGELNITPVGTYLNLTPSACPFLIELMPMEV